MDPVVCTAVSKGSPLPLGSLRLLVPPIQLMTASMWQVLKRQDVMNYWNVAEFVSLVMDMVPELLLHRHNVQLNLGLRARYILELCQSELPLESDFILSHLDKFKPSDASLIKEFQEEQVMSYFPELIEILLKDPEERKDYFGEIFPDQYGPQYDSDLQTLFWEFLCRLTQLLPVPDLEQTVSWLGADSSLMENCVQFVSEPAHMKTLLQHHTRLGHLEQHVPPSSMGDSILSSLSAAPSCRTRKPKDGDDTQDGVPFVNDVTVEIITVTDYAEVELGACNDTEGIMGENCFEGTSLAGAETVLEAEERLEPASAPPEVTKEGQPQSHPAPGPHDCPDCDKKFRFASSLTAHRVIHTGERPHRCHECGRCFSFRQSLDRHRNTHKTARRYDCAVCGEAFRSLSARTVHKQTHMEDGAYVCPRCGRKFAWELALAKHVKTHADDLEANAGSHEEERDVVRAEDSVALSTNDRPSDRPTSDCGNTEWVEERTGDAVAPGKVRSSGRKCKPTMKIQVINLQKRMTTKKRKETPAVLKPLPFNCTEHSYGSPVVSSKDSEEAGSSLDGFSCPKCSFRHSEEAEVQQHMATVHSEAEETKPSAADDGSHFSCQDCEKSFKFQSLLKAHRRIHTGEQPFLCAQCGRRFSFKQSLERHKHTHRSGRRCECPICGEFFKSPAAQREHKSAHMENGEYLCSECGRSFAWKSALVRHLKTHEGDGAERSHKCPRCDTGFTCASYLSRHMETHQEERAHKCSCGKSFAYQAALTAHQRTHQKERPHTCPQCGKGFIYKGGLRSHMKIHSEEMPFMCSHCGKCFKRERNMKKHERCHTRENVFRCSQCDKSFVYKATLTRHELTHSGERPYLCSDCGKGFFSHAELLKHERFHTGHKPFQCPYCGKRFTQSCYLTIHLRYHTGARPYSCTECDKSFLSANRLKRHQQTHTGEKPHVCGECGKGFRQSYHLKMHQRTHVLKLT